MCILIYPVKWKQATQLFVHPKFYHERHHL